MLYVDKYLIATKYFLGISEERYGRGYRAIICNRQWVDWLFELLEGNDLEFIQADLFLCDNFIFPSACGDSCSEAISNLDNKLLLTFDFSSQGEVISKFRLEAEYEDSIELFTVRWEDVMEDLYSVYKEEDNQGFFYQIAKDKCSTNQYKCLNALIKCDFIAHTGS